MPNVYLRPQTHRPLRNLCPRILALGVVLCAQVGTAEAQPASVSPPMVLRKVAPTFPAGAILDREIQVVLSVTVEMDGHVDEVAVVTSGGEDFDGAAIAAVKRWTFAPAMKDGRPARSRVRIPVGFVSGIPDAGLGDGPPPLVAEATEGPVDGSSLATASAASTAGATASLDGGAPEAAASVSVLDAEPAASPEGPPSEGPETFLDVTVSGERREQASTTSDYVVELAKLRIVPRQSAAEQLMLAPGVLTTNHGGEGHAHETYMRGFASKEGQDIEYTVDGVPVNDVSNPHGHGYADLYFVPPEFVRSVRITEGPFDPAQGDFAFAGSADYRLGVDERGTRLSYGYGSWNTQRLLLSTAPETAHRDTFAGFELHRSEGFGQNRASQRALGLCRYAGVLDSGLTWRLSAFGYATRFDQPGVVRQDDFLTGRMGFFDSYDPNQGGESNRLLLTLDTISGPADRRLRQVTWIGFRTMRLRVNFTGWMTDASVTAEGRPNTQRGDGLEMGYESLSAGSRGSYDVRTTIRSLPQTLSVGYALRFDQGDSSQLRLRSVTAIPYLRVFDDRYTILNLGGWLRGQIKPVDWLALRGGVRIDGFAFGVTDRNQPTADREGTRVSTQTSQSFGYAINPRLTIDTRIRPGLHVLASYGQGTRSTEAAALSDNETAPFARAQVLEGGLAHDLDAPSLRLRMKTQASYVFTHVDKDMLFDPVLGRNIVFSSAGSSNPVGPSTRHAVLFSTRADYEGWLDTLVNLGWARGRLDSTGELLPYIPQLIVRVDTGATGQLFAWDIGGVPVTGRVGVGFTYVPGRPLPYAAKGDDYYLFNLGGQVRVWHVSLGVEMRNLFDLRYRQSELNYASNFQGPNAVRSQRPVRHFTAGEPFFVMATLTVHLEALGGTASSRSITPLDAVSTGDN